jgi:hypothetical protein
MTRKIDLSPFESMQLENISLKEDVANKDAEIAALKLDLLKVNKRLLISNLLSKYEVGENDKFTLTSKSIVIEEAAT